MYCPILDAELFANKQISRKKWFLNCNTVSVLFLGKTLKHLEASPCDLQFSFIILGFGLLAT